MDPTALPTDNLYKFIALAGLGIAGFCLWFWWSRRSQLENALAELGRDTAAAEAKQKAIAQRFEVVAQQVKSTNSQLDKVFELRQGLLKMTLTTDREKEVTAYFEKETERLLEQQRRELGRSVEEHGKNAESLHDVLVLKARGTENKGRYGELHRLQKAMLICGALGVGLSFTGFSLWYLKLQRFTDEQTKADFDDHMADLAEKRAARAKAHTP